MTTGHERSSKVLRTSCFKMIWHRRATDETFVLNLLCPKFIQSPSIVIFTGNSHQRKYQEVNMHSQHVHSQQPPHDFSQDHGGNGSQQHLFDTSFFTGGTLTPPIYAPQQQQTQDDGHYLNFPASAPASVTPTASMNAIGRDEQSNTYSRCFKVTWTQKFLARPMLVKLVLRKFHF